MALNLIWLYCISTLAVRCDAVLSYMLKILGLRHVETLVEAFGDTYVYLLIMNART
jgi:hypothetical protein